MSTEAMRFLRKLFVSIAAVVCAATGYSQPADAIYFGGNIITINDHQPSAEAVAVRDGKILAVGDKAVVEKAHKGSGTDMIDLGGKTLLPGFVDAHSHIFQVAYAATFVNLLPPPDGPAGGKEIRSVRDITDALRAYLAENRSPEPTVIVGNGYDDSMLEEKRHPTKTQLDAVSKTIPVIVIHQSGHFSVSNQAALDRAGVGPDRTFKGGTVDYATGLLGEAAHVHMLMNLKIPNLDVNALQEGEKRYTSQGFTTVEDGRILADSWVTINEIFERNPDFRFRVDVAAYVDAQTLAAWMKTHRKPPGKFGRVYHRGFRVAGLKMTLDGSPQGRSAWLRRPYFHPPAGQAEGFKGEPNIPLEEVKALLADAYAKGRQVMMHVNGDAAIDEMIAAVGASKPGNDHRTVLIHGQFLQPDQIPKLKKLGIFPSLFPMHTFYWGDWYREEVAGPERADFISPTAAVLKAGMKFSIHSDAPVTFPNSMRILDSAVNRTTRTGDILGPAQRIEPIVALKAMTLWPAYQHFEESTKGSIEVGKLADFVILWENPLTVDRRKLADIKVHQTIKEGKRVYCDNCPLQ